MTVGFRESTSVDLVTNTLAELVTLYHSTNDETEQKWVKHLIQLGCRKLEDFITPRVSIKAKETADKMGVGDLSQYGWSEQKSKMNDPDRSVFHFEHVVTVSDLVERLLKLGSNPSFDSVKSVIGKADVAWILKSEDEVLNQNGFKSKRPDNPLEAYEQCGIELV